MSDDLGPLPEPALTAYQEPNAGDYYTADQMRAYAEQAIERLRRALHDIEEEWAGAECGEPVYAQEAYAIGLARRMYMLAVEARKP